ncbi:MAG: imidazole glycerol phosphate synthase subunit HisH [Kofleriaceae bacterium]
MSTARDVTIVDVCSGNLRSVERALAAAGARVTITRDPDVIRAADRIVVPGQGAFGVFMRGLADRNLGDALREAITSGRPYLGICLGMQVLFESSEEQGPVDGLGILGGRVVRLAPTDPRLKVPHIGWNRVRHTVHPSPTDGDVLPADPLFGGVADGAYFYFVHSFHAVPTDTSLLAATAEHGSAITAAVRKDNIFACQFHPEKSQAVGLRLLSNFVETA